MLDVWVSIISKLNIICCACRAIMYDEPRNSIDKIIVDTNGDFTDLRYVINVEIENEIY